MTTKCPTCKTRDPADIWKCLWCDYTVCSMPVAGMNSTCYVRHVEKMHPEKYIDKDLTSYPA